jgi:hypothetical protein
VDESDLKQTMDSRDHINEMPNLLDKKGKDKVEICACGWDFEASRFDNVQLVLTLSHCLSATQFSWKHGREINLDFSVTSEGVLMKACGLKSRFPRKVRIVHLYFKRTWRQSRAMTAWALQRKLNSRSELKITLQLAGVLRSICVQKWVWCMVV